MSANSPGPGAGTGAPLLDIYERALPLVYGYLLARCSQRSVAEDLASETFLAAAAASGPDGDVTVAWLLGVARHKLVDHWRRQDRQQRLLHAVSAGRPQLDDPWDVAVDAVLARRLLDSLAPQHRTALVLRYLDGLSVAEVAALMSRSVHATEALLVRARRELRSHYDREGGDDA